MRSRRSAFTLIELLVVMAIIGVLIALLIPAVQAARGAARRVECLNNMLQTSLGTLNYESAFESFPSGVVNPTGPISNTPNGYHYSWIVQVLPFLEQKTTYNHINFSRSVYDPGNDTARAVSIKAFLCPSDSAPRVDNKLAGTNFAATHHHVEAPIDTTNSGVMFLNSQVRIDDIEDGTSMTFLLGEKKREQGELGWASGTRASLRNGGTRLNATIPITPAATPNPVGGFSSFHPGGANFAYADGHVAFVRNSTNLPIYQRLFHRSDGELLPDLP